MVAVRKFDDEKTLQAVMEVFWRKGYERTSIDDIEAATGVKRGSLYNAYGGKEELFLLAFDRYSRHVEDQLIELLNGGEIREALARTIEAQIATLDDPTIPSGCLVANSLAEIGCVDGRIASAVRVRMEKSESAIYDRMVMAQAVGQVPAGCDIRALSRFVNSLMRILPILYRATHDGRAVRDVAKVALEAFSADRDAAG